MGNAPHAVARYRFPTRNRRSQFSRFVILTTVSAYVFLLGLALPSEAQTVTTVFSFNKSSGGNPDAVLLAQGRDGALYGTTAFGPTYFNGSVFRQLTGGANILLHEFDGSDGADITGLLHGKNEVR